MAACFHIDFASISQLPYMLQGHPSAVYQKNSEHGAFIRFKGINVQSGNSVACHFQLLLVSHSPGLRRAHLDELINGFCLKGDILCSFIRFILVLKVTNRTDLHGQLKRIGSFFHTV